VFVLSGRGRDVNLYDQCACACACACAHTYETNTYETTEVLRRFNSIDRYPEPLYKHTMDEVSIFLIVPGLITLRKRQRRWTDECGWDMHTAIVCGEHANRTRFPLHGWLAALLRTGCLKTDPPSLGPTTHHHHTFQIPTYLSIYLHTRTHTCPSLSACANVWSSGKGSPSTDSIHCSTSFSVVEGRPG
jgi:hypothetical protein